MLALSFFSLIFASILWLIFSINFIIESTKGISFFSAGLGNAILYVALVCLPIFLMWMVFSYINQYLQNKNTNHQLKRLFMQLQRNQDFTDLLARTLIETEQQIKNGFVLSKFDLLIADMNELLAEIIRSSNLASKEQIENLWARVQNGSKWSFGKVLIEIHNAQENFQMRIYENACKDAIFAGTILEFSARYLSVINLLEKHDKEKIFLNIIETGVMGKVFSIFAPISDEVRKHRETSATFNKAAPQETFKAPQPINIPQSPVFDEPTPTNKKKSFMSKTFNKKSRKFTQNNPSEIDPFSIALEKSFGPTAMVEPSISQPIKETKPSFEPQFEEEKNFDDEVDFNRESLLVAQRLEPLFEVSKPIEEEVVIEAQIEISNTQRTLDNLKKEWNDTKAENELSSEQPTEQPTEKNEPQSEENFAYPFSGWVDEQNYK